MRLIDADAVSRPIYAEEDNITGSWMTYNEMDAYNDGIDTTYREVENAPTIDAVPVVRCEDCVHYNNPQKCIVAYVAEQKRADRFLLFDKDWFCKDGERSET